MLRVGRRVWGVVCAVALPWLVGIEPVAAVSLDKDSTMKMGVRTYVNARIGTEHTDETLFRQPGSAGATSRDTRTFPVSGAMHLRQNRFFMEAEFDHELGQLVSKGFGPLALLNNLPFKIRGLKYHLVYRGEYDGLYDWGPNEYRTATQFKGLRDNPATAGRLDVGAARDRLRNIASTRHRLFQAYVEGKVGDVFVRLGRQILSWGETDGFRLIDNINPVDSSFGGFLIPLDERRVPLDMLRLQYDIGTYGPVSDAFLEFFGAVDNKVGFSPGTPAGSPWTLPNLGEPSRTTKTFIDRPRRNFADMRGGGRLMFNVTPPNSDFIGSGTFSLAHYWTYVDTPGLQVRVKKGFPAVLSLPEEERAFVYDNSGEKFSAEAVQSAPLVQITGFTSSFDIPALYTIFRSEVAYFKDEPRFRQSELDPFLFHFTRRFDETSGRFQYGAPDTSGAPNTLTGGRRTGDSINFVMGFDLNPYIRFLNPNQTFFISTQFFYKHLIGAAKRTGPMGSNRTVSDGEVLPVPEFNTFVAQTGLANFGAVQPSFVRQQTDQMLQTLFIATPYFSGQVTPAFGMFYDWSGAFVYQPSILFTRDPFRFAIDYSILDAGRLKGNSGVSLLRDRDNIQFRLEYVI